MRRYRWLLVLGMTLVLSGCSGTQVFGVAARDDGGVEIRSYCTNEGLTQAWITVDGDEVGRIRADAGEAVDVIVFPADGFVPPPRPDAVIRVEADYGAAGLYGEVLMVPFGELEPGTVVISSLEPEVVTPEEFEDRRVSCGFSSRPLILVLIAVVVAIILAVAVIAVPVVVILLSLRRRRREVTPF